MPALSHAIQVIILNMLIAIMAESHNRVASQSELVAQAGRAKLILEYETAEVARIRSAARRASHRAGGSTRSLSLDMGAIADLVTSGKSRKDIQRFQRVCPKWLHVLMPAEHQRGEDGDVAESLKQILQLKKQISEMDQSLGKTQTKLLDAVSKRDEQAERQKTLQAMRVVVNEALAEAKVKG